jgi:DNA helicase-4
LVDEFQDISSGRAEMVKALRRAQPDARLLAVGDDWQSIYRFAGSDVGIITDFESHFGHTETRFLRQTFRFDRRLEAVASSLVLRNPAQIRKQVEARAPDNDAPSVVLWLPDDDGVDDPLSAIAEDVLSGTYGRPDILVLGRYRALEAQAHLDRMAASYPQAAWRYSTIHRAKGATADCATILGVRGGRQPFPAERSEDPLLARDLGIREDFPHAEERRLFYGALTRARIASTWSATADGRRPSLPSCSSMAATSPFVIAADGLHEASPADSDPARHAAVRRAAPSGWDTLCP